MTVRYAVLLLFKLLKNKILVETEINFDFLLFFFVNFKFDVEFDFWISKNKRDL